MPDHLPPLPLFIDYQRPTLDGFAMLTEQDESGIYHALRLHGRVSHIKLVLQPSILKKVIMLMDEHFPILQHLSLKVLPASENSVPLTLPKAFLAPNLRHLTLPGISPPRRLRLLTSTPSLVTLDLSNIETSGYFRPRLLVARLQSLPRLKELSIEFSTPIPHPGTERELIGEQGTLTTLPSLKNLRLKGVGAYLESFVAQIRVPRLEQLRIMLFSPIAFELPHIFHLINITEALKFPTATIYFDNNEVYIGMSNQGTFLFHVICKQLGLQADYASQICHALIPALSGIQRLRLLSYRRNIPNVFQHGATDSATWHGLLRMFTELTDLYICDALVRELSHALQMGGVGSDPGFLPNLRSIHAQYNQFAPFINTRQVVGRPVQFDGSDAGYWSILGSIR